MSNDFELSRRKALAALGSIGVASAGAGLGTSAYFSDQETFQNNRLVAGELDLKMDWEEHYSDWSADEGDISGEDGDFSIEMEDPNSEAFRPFPPTTGVLGDIDPLIWVPNEYVDDFMDNTSLEAFPDIDNDGTAEFPVDQIDGEPCEFLADVGGQSNGLGEYTTPDTDDLGRTDNDDTRTDDGPAPLINLQDVKPGDFGEITFSVHLCDNPGYLWMNMPDGLEASENGLTEPERDDPDEDQTLDEDGNIVPKEGADDTGVELLDKLQVALWYDDCDNLYTCQDKIDIMLLADTSNSIAGSLDDTDPNDPADQLAASGGEFLRQVDMMTDDGQVQVGLLTFNGPGEAGEPDPTSPQEVFDRPAWRAGLGPIDQFDSDGDGNLEFEEFLPVEGNGNTPMPHALDLGQKILVEEGRNDAEKVIVMVTDGLPDYNPEDADDDIPYEVLENEGSPLTPTGNSKESEGFDSLGATGTSDSTEKQETEDEATEIQGDGINVRVVGVGLSPDGDTFLRTRVAGDDADPAQVQDGFYYPPDEFDDVFDLTADVAEDVTGGVGECEELITSGTLREVAEELTANDGRGIPLEGNLPAEQAGGTGRDCFNPFATHCFGFAWWLPLNHGNEVQSDSVSFDLGFYTEQCRHNDGSGMNSEEV